MHHDQQTFELRSTSEPERVVRGRVRRPASSGAWPWVLVLHGFKGFMDWGFFPELSRRLADAGMASVLFNTSGSGIGPDLESFSEEEAFARGTLSRQLEDMAQVLQHVRSGALPGLDLARAALFGHSRGGGMGLIHAAETGAYRAVATWGALDDVDRYGDAVKAAWRREGKLPILNSRTGQVLRIDVEVLEDFERHRDRFDIPAACARLHVPALLLHGGADESVDPGSLDRLAAALPGSEAVLIQSAGHTFGAEHPLATVTEDLEFALRKTVGWLQAQLQGAGGR